MSRKSITFTILTIIATVVLIYSWPSEARVVLNNFIKGINSIQTIKLPLPGQKEPLLRVVDPDVISSTLKKETSSLISLFEGKSVRVGNLVVEDVIDATNKERLAAGLAPLKVNALLASSAEIKTKDMIAGQYFEHESPTGVTVSELGDKVGYRYIIMGENLALGNFNDASDLVTAWMDSPGHRENILSPLYQEIGVYVALASYNDHEVWFAVQHFGTNRSVCPSINRELKGEVDAINRALSIKQSEISALQKEIEESNPHTPEYREKVEAYNIAVEDYNQTLEISKQKISVYNYQVGQFNTCLAKYQK